VSQCPVRHTTHVPMWTNAQGDTRKGQAVITHVTDTGVHRQARTRCLSVCHSEVVQSSTCLTKKWH
jgi:hypothetical protein